MRRSTGNSRDAADHVGPVWAQNFCLITVGDTGVGMTAEIAEGAIEPFFITKPHRQAPGRGLSTAYGIITQAGGRLAIRSEPGVGTTVYVYLPGVGRSTAAAPATPTGANDAHQTVGP